jgi:hypothetical protein
MNALRWFGAKAGSASEESVTVNPNWRTYRAGDGDRAGRKIRKVYAVGDDYVLYFIASELYYETGPTLEKGLGPADSLLARINRLLDANPPENTREYYVNVSTLELAADAFEMFFSGERDEALEILSSIRDKLQAKEEGQRRLAYQGGAVLITAVVWIVYLVLLYLRLRSKFLLPAEWYSWMLASSLAMLGGLFSVCLNIGSLEVNVNQQPWFLPIAGATRSIVAFLAGIALLLAVRSKMFAGIVYQGDIPSDGAPLQLAEKFFCFIAGFSESFVPNILSKTADAKTADAKAASDNVAADQAAAAEQAAVDKAAADKAAADKAAADKDTADKDTADKDTADKDAGDKAAADKAAADEAAAGNPVIG